MKWPAVLLQRHTETTVGAAKTSVQQITPHKQTKLKGWQKKKGFKGIKDPDASWKDHVREARRTGRIILNSGQQSGMNLRGIFKRISMMINVASMNWNLMDAIRFSSVNVMKWKGQGN